ncbi:hypothetical protein Q1695_003465 [Nippostrongylus brasiliensis]|nr:hypothetical protein Q1695_003465 [Nippostrongylus brasiliensis]
MASIALRDVCVTSSLSISADIVAFWSQRSRLQRTHTISIEKGVRQGDTMSPKLPTAALRDAMKNLDWDAKGYPVDGERINNLRSADDIVLIAKAEEMLSELNMAGREIGFDMNMSKTQFMVNQWCDTGLVKLNGVALHAVDSYVCL